MQTIEDVQTDSMFIDTIYDIDTSDGAKYEARMFVFTKKLTGQSKAFK